jgi:hypothetical protein
LIFVPIQYKKTHFRFLEPISKSVKILCIFQVDPPVPHATLDYGSKEKIWKNIALLTPLLFELLNNQCVDHFIKNPPQDRNPNKLTDSDNLFMNSFKMIVQIFARIFQRCVKTHGKILFHFDFAAVSTKSGTKLATVNYRSKEGKLITSRLIQRLKFGHSFIHSSSKFLE